MHVEDENLGENVVAAELQKGYTYKESIVRQQHGTGCELRIVRARKWIDPVSKLTLKFT